MAIPQGLLDGIDNLDPLPFTVQQLIAALETEEISFREIGKVIEYDPAIAANILRVANSALYAGRTHIEKPQDAVVRLGTATLLNIVLGGYLRELTVSAPLYSLSENELWLHAAVSSIAVREVSRETAKIKIPQTSSIAALIHDVGKLIIVRYLNADVTEIQQLCKDNELTWVEAEAELFQCNHAEVGGAIGRKWSFPDPIVESIERHHDYPLDDSSPMLDAVVVANLVSKTIGVGLGAEGMNFRADEQCHQRLGIDFRAFCRVCARTSTQIADLKKTYGIEDHGVQ